MLGFTGVVAATAAAAFVDLSIVLLTEPCFDGTDDALEFGADDDDDNDDDNGWAGIIKRGPPREPAPPPVLAVARPVDAERLSPAMPGALGPKKYGSAIALLLNPK